MWESALQWAAIVTGLLSAALWLWASTTRIPPFPDVGADSGSEVFEPVRQALVRGATINAWAAGVTALAVLAQALSLALHAISA